MSATRQQLTVTNAAEIVAILAEGNLKEVSGIKGAMNMTVTLRVGGLALT